jgi:hypothetical protein
MILEKIQKGLCKLKLLFFKRKTLQIKIHTFKRAGHYSVSQIDTNRNICFSSNLITVNPNRIKERSFQVYYSFISEYDVIYVHLAYIDGQIKVVDVLAG